MAVDLVDALLRQQVFYEMWKEHEAQEGERTIEIIIAAVIGVIAGMDKQDFATMTRTEVQGLIERVNRTVRKPLGELSRNTEKFIRETLVTVTRVTMANYNAAEGTNRSRVGKTAAERAAQVIEEATGAGVTVKEMVSDFAAGFVKKVRVGIQTAYANKWSIAELLKYIKGDAAKGYKDGVLNKLKNEIRALIKTAMQHVQAWADYNVGRLFHDFYQWISVLDMATTDICRSRHRNVYRYGAGPLPPAHYNCRSRIVAVAADMSNQIPPDFYSWISRQPDAFLEKALLPSDYAKVKDGTATKRDFPNYANRKTATRAQFEKNATTTENS